MSVTIKNHSNGNLASVTNENQLSVVSENHELQHHNSWHDGQVYQILAIDTTVTATTDQLVHLKNTSTTHNMVITFIRLQAVTDITVAEATEYWSLHLNDTVASGGSAGTPVNMNASSGNVAACTCTVGDPTMDGVGSEIDRYYPNKSGDEVAYNKQGSMILGLNDTMHISFTSGAAAGHAKARITFMMINKDRD